MMAGLGIWIGQRRYLACFAMSMGLLSAVSARAETVLGFARDARTQRFLYTEVHEFNRSADGEVQSATCRYYDAQGKEMARKSLDYRSNRFIPVYTLEMPAQRYTEGISSNADPVVVFKKNTGQEAQASLPRDDGLEAADAGFNHLLMAQMPKLRKGETVNFKLIVAGRTDRFRFRVRKLADVKVEQEPGIKLLVEPDSLLRMLVAPIEIVYDAAGKRLLNYSGVSNIIDPSSGEVFRHVNISYVGPTPNEARWPPSQAEPRSSR